MPGERKSVEPLAAVTAPARVAAQHQSLLHFVGQGPWSDGKIDGADPTIANCSGSMTVRFDGTTLVAEAAAGTPLVLEYGFTTAGTALLKFEMARVFLSKPKYTIAGPGGVEAGYDWRAAFDSATGSMLKVTLVNDVASYT